MSTPEILAEFGSRLVILGFGCIGRGMLPLLLRHVAIRPEQIRIVSDDARHRDVAAEYGVDLRAQALTPENYQDILAEELGPGDFLLNLSVSVGSVDLIAWCQADGRRIQRLDPARGTRGPVRRGRRFDRSLAVQERPGLAWGREGFFGPPGRSAGDN